MINRISELAEGYRTVASEVADKIWGYAELAGGETRSVAEYVKILKEYGFEVKTNVGNVPTAFKASYGSGSPVIGLLAEYDAVSGVSQQADVLTPVKEDGMDNGHACGHNLLGAGCLQAFLALRDYIEENSIKGTVVLFGCPAEECGGGKTFMARGGVFDGVDIALSWHPGDWTGIIMTNLQADNYMRYKFTGRSSHAAAAPEMGRSALDSVEIMNVGANYLREHVSSDVCFHYALIDTGGTSPNVVQNHATVDYLIRAADLRTVNEVRERINNIAKGSALMNGTETEAEFITGCSPYQGNSSTGYQVYSSMQELGEPQFSEEERAFAGKVAETFFVKGAPAVIRPFIRELQKADPEKGGLENAALNSAIMPYAGIMNTTAAGTSDVGDVSQNCPAIMFMVTCWAQGTPGHSWQAVAQGKSSLAHTGMTYAAKVMALTAAHYFETPALVEEAKKEFKENHPGPYECPVPDSVAFGAKNR